MKNVPKPLDKGVLVPLGLTTSASITGKAIHKKIFGSGCPCILALRPLDLASRMTLLIIQNEEMNDLMKIDKSLEESGLLIKGVSETIKNEAKKQKGGGFINMLLGTLGASLLGTSLTGKGTIRAGESTIKTVQVF